MIRGLAETVPADVDERDDVHIVRGADAPGTAGVPFPWARLGTPALLRYSRPLGWRTVDQWAAGGRCFVALRSRSTSSSAEPPKSTAVTSSQRARKPSPDRPVAEE